MIAKLISKIKTVVKTVTSPTYNRASFVSASKWKKARLAILVRDKIGDHWICKYSNLIIKNATDIDVDHIVPLKFAWINGAYKWTTAQRLAFAIDPDNLISVNEHENRSKGDDGLLEYLPDNNVDFYCKHWKIVTDKYKIKLSTAEIKVINASLSTTTT